MIRCASCGGTNAEGALACTACGAALVAASPALAATSHEGSVLSTTPSALLPGELLAGRYELLDRLGKGGAGVVFRARDLVLKEEIALKLLQQKDPGGADEAEVERFKREIVTARRITHPGVIRIHDLGMSGADVFISMELLTGGSLTTRLRQGMKLSAAMDVAIGICDGLQAAHELGIVHRDLKPDNVLFDAAGKAKIADFGLARFQLATTRTVGFSGTPFYMSPEHANGADVTTRSDIYSLGVVFYETFSGRLPFYADNFLRLVTLHCNEPAPSMLAVRPDLPPELDRLVLRMLAKDPAKRFATAREVGAALRRIRASLRADPLLRVSDPSNEATLRPPSPVSVQAVVLHAPAPAAARSRRRLLVAVPLGLAAAAAAIAVVPELRGRAPATPSPIPSPTVATETSAPSSPAATATATLAVTAAPEPTPSRAPRPVSTRVATRPSPTPTPARPATPAPTAATVSAHSLGTLKVTGTTLIEVSVDGKLLGTAPLQQALPPGTHAVKLVAKGETLRVKTTTLTIKAGATQHLFFDADKDELQVK